MKALPNKAAQVIDPETSTTNEDPLWAPSWSLPKVKREPDERAYEEMTGSARRDRLDRLGEAMQDAG